MNDMKHDDLERDIASIAEKLAPGGSLSGGPRPVSNVRPRFLPAATPAPVVDPVDPYNDGSERSHSLTLARLTVRARIIEAVVTQSIAAHQGRVTFTADDMQRMEEAERQVFGIGL